MGWIKGGSNVDLRKKIMRKVTIEPGNWNRSSMRISKEEYDLGISEKWKAFRNPPRFVVLFDGEDNMICFSPVNCSFAQVSSFMFLLFGHKS